MDRFLQGGGLDPDQDPEAFARQVEELIASAWGPGVLAGPDAWRDLPQQQQPRMVIPPAVAASARGNPERLPGSPSIQSPSNTGTVVPIPGASSVAVKSVADVRKTAEARSKSIFTSYDMLRGIIQRHEATLQKRWAKKSRKQRLDILAKNWGPGMPAQHRPDFHIFKKEQQRSQNKKVRDCFMWPYINQDDLGAPQALCVMLNARGRHPPCAFAAADLAAMNLGIVSGAFSRDAFVLDPWVMVLNGAETADRYGMLVSWEEQKEAWDWLPFRQGRQFLPLQGLLILEAQERLMAFLVGCCKQLLHDIPSEDLLADAKFPIIPAPQLKTASVGFESLAALAAEAPYRAPADLDLGRIESLLTARVSAAEDHLWALREDPSYLTDTLLELREHQQEQNLDPNGQKHPLMTKTYTTNLWAKCISTMLTMSVNELEILSQLLGQVKELRALHLRHAAAISPQDALPEDYLYALLKLRVSLCMAASGPQRRLAQSFPASPPVRRFWCRLSGNDVDQVEVERLPCGNTRMEKAREDLTDMLTSIWQNDRNTHIIKLTTIVDELNRMIEAEPLVKDHLSSLITHTIGLLSVIAECLRQLEIYQPWANNFESAQSEREDRLCKEWDTFASTRLQPLLGAFQFYEKEKRLSQPSMFGNIMDGRFDYPVTKRRTKETVEALKRAEDNLDDFWAKMDRHVHSRVKLEGTALGQLLSQNRSLQRTPDWVDLQPESGRSTEQKPADDRAVDALVKPLSAFYFGRLAGDVDKSEYEPARLKSKIKTTGTADTKAATGPAADVEENPLDPQPTIAVDARSLKAFRTIFFNPANSTPPGELAWTDFVHALTHAGFAAEKLYGSVWQFRPTGLDVERPIQFHEPHPGVKMAYTIARRHGRRLNRAYGWYLDMFVLKEKGTN